MRWKLVALILALGYELGQARQGATAMKYLPKRKWQDFFKHTGDTVCSPGFYQYEAFVEAVKAFPQFATSSTPKKNRRELAAFLAQISAETTGGWPTAPDGPWSWGLCFKREGGNGALPAARYCAKSEQYTCARGKQYYGRGPMQLSWNYNYGAAGNALGLDLLANPDLVTSDPVIAFKTALWFWHTAGGVGRPSCHDIMAGLYTPTAEDRAANRTLGFGWTTNLINGNLECGNGTDANPNRLLFYKVFAKKLRTKPFGEVSCAYQKPYPACC